MISVSRTKVTGGYRFLVVCGAKEMHLFLFIPLFVWRAGSDNVHAFVVSELAIPEVQKANDTNLQTEERDQCPDMQKYSRRDFPIFNSEESGCD